MSRGRHPRPSIPCKGCNGCGTVLLPLHLYRVLLEMQQLKSATAATVRRQLYTLEDVKPTAMCNRLAALEQLGFLVGRRDGKNVVYSLAPR